MADDRSRARHARRAAGLAPSPCARAEAYIYWTESGRNAGIGRANLDGTGVDRGFLDQHAYVITADAGHLYWSDRNDDVSRSNIDGTSVDPSFIDGLVPVICSRGCSYMYDLAVDGAHVYGTGRGGFSHGERGAIGRANLDGTGVDQRFITTSDELSGLAVDASHVFWATLGSFPGPGSGSIGRANLDGTGVNERFIISGNDQYVVDVAVDAGHVYWTHAGCVFRPTPECRGGTIGRANLDGTDVDYNFITLTRGAGSLEVDENYLYWANYDYDHEKGMIGCANVDGTGVNERFISGLGYPYAIAVNALQPPGEVTAKRTQRQKGERIRIQVRVKAKERLTAKAGGKIKVNPTYKLKPKSVRVDAGQTKTLKLKPTNAAAKKIAQALEHGKKAKAKVKVKLTGQAGNSAIEELRVRLKREQP